MQSTLLRKYGTTQSLYTKRLEFGVLVVISKIAKIKHTIFDAVFCMAGIAAIVSFCKYIERGIGSDGIDGLYVMYVLNGFCIIFNVWCSWRAARLADKYERKLVELTSNPNMD